MTRTRLLTSLVISLSVLGAVLVYNQFRGGSETGEGTSYAISGRVVVTAGPLPDGLRVRVRWLDDGQVRTVTVPVRPDGTFTVDRLVSGLYTLTAIAPAEGDGAAPRTLGTTEISVGDGDVTGVTLGAG